jgi:hypothetical protein
MMEKQAIAVASKIAKIRKIRRLSSPAVETIDAMILATLLGRLLETSVCPDLSPIFASGFALTLLESKVCCRWPKNRAGTDLLI